MNKKLESFTSRSAPADEFLDPDVSQKRDWAIVSKTAGQENSSVDAEGERKD